MGGEMEVAARVVGTEGEGTVVGDLEVEDLVVVVREVGKVEVTVAVAMVAAAMAMVAVATVAVATVVMVVGVTVAGAMAMGAGVASQPLAHCQVPQRGICQAQGW